MDSLNGQSRASIPSCTSPTGRPRSCKDGRRDSRPDPTSGDPDAAERTLVRLASILVTRTGPAVDALLDLIASLAPGIRGFGEIVVTLLGAFDEGIRERVAALAAEMARSGGLAVDPGLVERIAQADGASPFSAEALAHVGELVRRLETDNGPGIPCWRSSARARLERCAGWQRASSTLLEDVQAPRSCARESETLRRISSPPTSSTAAPPSGPHGHRPERRRRRSLPGGAAGGPGVARPRAPPSGDRRGGLVSPRRRVLERRQDRRRHRRELPVRGRSGARPAAETHWGQNPSGGDTSSWRRGNSGRRHRATSKATVQRFRAYNLAHAELLDEILGRGARRPGQGASNPRSPGTSGGRLRRLLRGRQRRRTPGGIGAEADRQPGEGHLSRERPSGSLSPGDTVRRIQMFEDPKSLDDVTTLHGLKRYAPRGGLRLAFRLFQSYSGPAGAPWICC